MILFRHADPRYPFLIETGLDQAPGRWNQPGDGPTQYLADTPDGAWAEFLRHEEIRDPADLAGIQRSLWAVDVGTLPIVEASLSADVLTGGLDSYLACQAAAQRLRQDAQPGLVAPSAALLPGAASGWRVQSGLRPGTARDGRTVVLFGERPDLTGWRTAADGRPDAALLANVRHFWSDEH